MISGIYKIVNHINYHFYIGSAKNFYNRWHIHKHQLKENKHHSKYLQRACNLYGIDNFRFHILECCEPEKLIEREQFYIDTLKPEYNISLIAGSCLGVKRSEETKKKQSILKIGKPGPRLGATVTQEIKNKISAKLTNHKQSQETIVKRSISMKGNTNAKGKRSKEIINSQYRKFDKWPCADGIRCKCENCLAKHAAYHRNRRRLINASK